MHNFIYTHIFMPSVIWHCWLGIRKGIWPAKSSMSAVIWQEFSCQLVITTAVIFYPLTFWYWLIQLSCNTGH